MKQERLVLPALRGAFGDWIYYTCLMSPQELAVRVSYAHEIHPNKALSELIQRRLEGKRANHISQYLRSTPERFFNALVLATYRGDPQWYEVGNFDSGTHKELLSEISERARDSIGFLMLNGSEKIFAVDGQHRLAGIKKALKDGTKLEDEFLPVILVGHKTSALGLRRTRRLFTTLNKTAIPVAKADIIALDEDDVMAIICRRLVENDSRFMDPKIAVISSANIPQGNRTCLTTISSLYDVLKLLFKAVRDKEDGELRFNRPTDVRLEYYEQLASGYFSALAKAFKPVNDLFVSRAPAGVAGKYRTDEGGHLLFRPVGLAIVTRAAIDIAKRDHISIPDAVACLRHIPTELNHRPYRGVIWDNGRVNLTNKALALALVRYMVGLKVDKAKLLKHYQNVLDTGARLPRQVAP
jgi:DNA sulfur modification protein DndB